MLRLNSRALISSSALVSLLAACSSGSTASPDYMGVAELKITPNFTQSRTGWVKPDGSSIKFSIQQNLILAGVADRYECRVAFKPLIDSASWADCSNGTFTPTATAGSIDHFPNDNGTYRFEVRAKKNNEVKRSAFAQFYVHPSLNGVPDCVSSSISDAQYFAEAANQLSMTDKFGAQTNLTGPKFTIEFNRPYAGSSELSELRSIVSLRKSLKMNGDRSLILVRRVRPKWVGVSDYTLDGQNRRSVVPSDIAQPNTRSAYLLTNSACTLAIGIDRSLNAILVRRLVSDGAGGVVNNRIKEQYYNIFNGDFAVNTEYEYDSSVFFNEVLSWSTTKARKIYQWRGQTSARVSEISSYLDNEVSANRRPDRPGMLMDALACDALVFNANGKGLCFSGDRVSYAISLRNITGMFLTERYSGLRQVSKAYYSRSLSHFKLYNDSKWNSFLNDATAPEVSEVLARYMTVND